MLLLLQLGFCVMWLRAVLCGSDAVLDVALPAISSMSDMFTVAKQLVKGCQPLVMDPTSLLQQSLVNTVPDTMMVH